MMFALVNLHLQRDRLDIKILLSFPFLHWLYHLFKECDFFIGQMVFHLGMSVIFL